MSRFHDMCAIVIGGADNIGRATARLLARDGAKVCIAYNSNVTGADETIRLIKADGGEAFAQQLDQSNEDQIVALIDRTVGTYGGLHILVNNAARIDPAFLMKDRDIARMDGDYWDEVMRINLKGPMLACKHAIPHMIKEGYGSIINTGSGVVFRGDTVRNAYSASKIALHSMTMDIATSYGKHNIRCNLVSPGQVMTKAVQEYQSVEFTQALAAQNLVPFVAEPQDIAEVTCFLASKQARYVTGQIIAVDGGLHVHQCLIGQT